MSRTTSGPSAGNQRRFTIIRTLAIALLVLAVAGGASAGRLASGPQVAAATPAAIDAAELSRSDAAYARVDRRYREAAEQAVEQLKAEAEAEAQRGGRATDAEVQPPPPPPPPPADAPAGGSDGGGSEGGGQSGEPAGPVPASCSEYSGNRATGCTLVVEAGHSLDQMSCLDSLWTRESGWNELAQNPSSGAYGIPQALPGDKMAAIGDDWRTNPATQIRWGLSYIEGRYGTPCDAWGFFQSNGWY